MRLLSIDWDAFFPASEMPMLDWGHREIPFLIENIWPIRAEPFVRLGLPLPPLSGEEETFWDRVSILGADLYIADSHSYAAHAEVLAGIEEIVNYDAHHDLGYTPRPLACIKKTGDVHCDDWGVYAAQFIQGRFTSVLPRWAHHPPPRQSARRGRVRRDDGRYLGKFDRVFVCRSGAWVPSWHDIAFFRFLEQAGLRAGVFTFLQPVCLREFDLGVVEAIACETQQFIDRMEEKTE